MNIFILRHGIAVDRGTPGFDSDSERPLTPKGERKLLQVADAMEAMNLNFDIILTSPFIRARDTARIIADSLGAKKRLQETDDLTPGGSPKNLIEHIQAIKPAPENILLVGHEPYLSQLVSFLIAGDIHALVLLKKGGLCKLNTDGLRYARCAMLEWLLTPKQMGVMA